VNSTIVVPITASFDAAASDAASPRAVPESCACQRWTATTPAARPKAFSANSSSPFAIISTGVDRVLEMLLSAKLESLAGELPPHECAEGGANPTESTDARASATRVELTHQTAFYKSYLAAFARI
jgi:hypothetical protein